MPAQRVFGEGAEVAGVDAPPAERLDEGDAVAAGVVRHYVVVGGNQGAQELAEGDVHGRDIVHRPNAHAQYVPRRLGRLLRHAAHQVRVELAVGQHPRPTGRDALQVGDATFVDRQVGVEDRGDEE